jgi:hypothetical protein
MRAKLFREIPRKWFAAYRRAVVSFFHPISHAHYGPDEAGARHETRRCIAVIKMNLMAQSLTDSPRIAFGMPVCDRGRVATVRTSGVWSLSSVRSVIAAGAKRRDDATGVSGRVFGDVSRATGLAYRHIAAAGATDVFPGTSAWSPPT